MPDQSAAASAPDSAPAKFKFFVYIIESPSAPDLYHGRSEGGLLAQTLRLDLIPCVTRTAINTKAFVAALRIGLPEAMKQCPGRHPILHLSAHGGREGIQLSSGQIVTWARLREHFVPINDSLQKTLLLCMSACEGYGACRMAMEVRKDSQPYFAMIGNSSTPTWSDTAVSYLSFYHLLAKGWGIPNAVEAMKIASGDPNWIVQTADEIKRNYIEFINNNNVELAAALRRLATVAQDSPLSPNAKALETEGHD